MLDQETWRFINTFAPWLSAAGTVTAVAVSLYLARQDRRVRLSVNASIWILQTLGQEDHEEFITVNVIRSFREITVTGFGWEI
jgi:hypothetical protein